MRGITIRVNRANAIRVIGAAMRDKQSAFEKEKRQFPRKVELARKAVIARLKLHLKAAASAKHDELASLVNQDIMPWKERNSLIPAEPTLNLCREKQLLLMLQNDVRDIVPVNSNHDLWAVLQGKCEVVR